MAASNENNEKVYTKTPYEILDEKTLKTNIRGSAFLNFLKWFNLNGILSFYLE